MEQIIRSWGFTQEEYRYKLARLMPFFLLALFENLDEYIKELEMEVWAAVESKDKQSLSKWIEDCRKVQATVFNLRSLLAQPTFWFEGLDCSSFDHHGSFEIGDLRIFLHNPTSPLVIPSEIVREILHSVSFSDEELDIFNLAVHKSEVARHENADPRTYWPVLESRRRD